MRTNTSNKIITINNENKQKGTLANNSAPELEISSDSDKRPKLCKRYCYECEGAHSDDLEKEKYTFDQLFHPASVSELEALGDLWCNVIRHSHSIMWSNFDMNKSQNIFRCRNCRNYTFT